MRVLEYSDLDTSRVKASYLKIKAALERDDFRSADVKKLRDAADGKYYRARLDHANRLLFTVVRHLDEPCALILEVVENHEYDRSRFLRGARIDEDKIPPIEAPAAVAEARPVRYVHPHRTRVHLLDKIISFDDAQEAFYRLSPPAIVVGSAGSGKTALALEKLKQAPGEVLYVTLSAYLAQSAREQYFAHGFERDGQEISFLSYREFVDTLKVPAGREATWRDFSGWFSRMRQAFKGIDAHQAFEEIRGVVSADAGGPLSREAYLALGVRQSIFAPDRRDAVYDLFLKYGSWLGDANLHDLNLLAHQWRQFARPVFDFVVVDEVQDLTNAQLALVLATLKQGGRFILCGDSNQIVHPNFFSWGRVKSLFWQDPALADRQQLHILRSNFRNGAEATRLANTLLKIKHRRFGSIDRESNYLVEAVTSEEGATVLLPDKEAVKRDLDARISASTRFAVLVPRDEDKADAARCFRTPLIFSVHEAKGLEYENIVLYRFISGYRQEFREIADGVSPEDLAVAELAYGRASDKSDKSLDVYKFYVNALYVALTRAIKNIYLIESDTGHPLLRLLGVTAGSEQVQVDAQASSLEEWQREARKLELQGKLEQAEAIRKTVLRQSPVPWQVFDRSRLYEALEKVFVERVPAPRYRHLLFEFAACYGIPTLAAYLHRCVGYKPAEDIRRQFPVMGRKHFGRYDQPQFKDIIKECDRHGVDHRTPMNLTPLITAAALGNVALVDALLERGADVETSDAFGCNALHWAMRRAFAEPAFAREVFPSLYERLAPPAVDLRVGERLVRLDRHISEYFLFQAMWALFRDRFSATGQYYDPAAFSTDTLLRAYEFVPRSVLRDQRRHRAFLSAVLSRNEKDRDYAYNRQLFIRLRQGWYQFNPALSVRGKRPDGDVWTPIYEALGLATVKELCEPGAWGLADFLLGKDPRATMQAMPMAGALFFEMQKAGTLAAGQPRPGPAAMAATGRRR
ncbi:MAG: AAA family ATPase [Candidatus Sericytochromatia bacterium]|nr:AAA family ATPase [Candidatus Tanganyikabacteria bacterium]